MCGRVVGGCMCRVCVVGSMHGGRGVWQRTCVAGGVHGRGDDHYSGRYASYWNAFMLLI